MSTAWGDGTRVGVRLTCSRQSAEPLLWLEGRAGARLKPRTGDGRRRPAGGDGDVLIAPGLVRFPPPGPKGPSTLCVHQGASETPTCRSPHLGGVQAGRQTEVGADTDDIGTDHTQMDTGLVTDVDTDSDLNVSVSHPPASLRQPAGWVCQRRLLSSYPLAAPHSLTRRAAQSSFLLRKPSFLSFADSPRAPAQFNASGHGPGTCRSDSWCPQKVLVPQIPPTVTPVPCPLAASEYPCCLCGSRSLFHDES